MAAQGSAFLDDPPVVTGGGENHDRLRMNLRDHLLNTAEAKAGGHMVALRVGVKKGLVRFHDTDNLNIGAVHQSAGGCEGAALQGKLDVPVLKADNAHLQWRIGIGGSRQWLYGK